MYYYVIEKIGDGTEGNPFRPNIEDGISYVCSELNNMFIVGINEVISSTKISDLQTFCVDNHLTEPDLKKWFVGDAL